MVRCFAAAVIHYHGLAEQLRDQHRRKRSEHEREVRRRKDMDNVCRPEFTKQQRPVGQLCHNRPQILDCGGMAERSARYGIDWNEPRADVRIVVPAAEQPFRLNRLTAEDSHRRSDDRDVEPRTTHVCASSRSSANGAPTRSRIVVSRYTPILMDGPQSSANLLLVCADNSAVWELHPSWRGVARLRRVIRTNG